MGNVRPGACFDWQGQGAGGACVPHPANHPLRRNPEASWWRSAAWSGALAGRSGWRRKREPRAFWAIGNQHRPFIGSADGELSRVSFYTSRFVVSLCSYKYQRLCRAGLVQRLCRKSTGCSARPPVATVRAAPLGADRFELDLGRESASFRENGDGREDIIRSTDYPLNIDFVTGIRSLTGIDRRAIPAPVLPVLGHYQSTGPESALDDHAETAPLPARPSLPFQVAMAVGPRWLK